MKKAEKEVGYLETQTRHFKQMAGDLAEKFEKSENEK